MAAAAWTDKDVADLNAAHWFVRLCDGAVPGFEAIQPLSRSWITAVVRYGEAVQGEGPSLPSARHGLQRLARQINELAVTRPAGAALLKEPTVSPEATLRAAGISGKRQAKYQRRMSSLLAGRA
jgi:hypothetical protein